MKANDRIEAARRAVEQAKRFGADEAAATVSSGRDVQVSRREGKIETLSEASRNQLRIDIYIDKKYSSHVTSDLRPDALAKFVEEATAATKYLSKDEFRGLADPKYYPTALDKDLGLTDATYDGLTSERRALLAKDIEEATLAQSDKFVSVTATYQDSLSESATALSSGFEGERRSNSFTCGAEATVKDGDERPSGWRFATSRRFDELPKPEEIGKGTAAEALGKIGQKKISTGEYDVIVENRAMRRLLGALLQPTFGYLLQQRRSFLEGKLGEKIASEKLTLIDDPFVPKGLGSRLFDDDALAAKRRPVLEKGVLRTYFLDAYYARKLGMEPTSGSTSNILFENGDRSLEAMVADLRRGLVITGFIGGNSNTTTGDFSFGVVGKYVENGEVVHPVNETNLSGNLSEFWSSVDEVGADPYPYSSYLSPSIRFADAKLSGA
jgi:PmbA protein